MKRLYSRRAAENCSDCPLKQGGKCMKASRTFLCGTCNCPDLSTSDYLVWTPSSTKTDSIADDGVQQVFQILGYRKEWEGLPDSAETVPSVP